MKITTLNIDDAVREKRRIAYEAGEDWTNMLMKWSDEAWEALTTFTKEKEGRVYFLGAYHERV